MICFGRQNGNSEQNCSPYNTDIYKLFTENYCQIVTVSLNDRLRKQDYTRTCLKYHELP